MSSLMLQLRWGWHIPATWDSPRVSQGLFMAAQMSFLARGQTHRHTDRALGGGRTRHRDSSQTGVSRETSNILPQGKHSRPFLPLPSASSPSSLMSLINGSCWPARLGLFPCINKADAGIIEQCTSQRCCGFPGQLQPPSKSSSPEAQGMKCLICATKNLPEKEKLLWVVNHHPKHHNSQLRQSSLEASNQARYTNLARGRN